MLRPRPAAELIPWEVLRTDLRAHLDAIVRDWVALLDRGAGERACLDFLNEHAGFFFCDSIQRLLAISELELGADLRPDFVVSTDMASYGLYYEFIEIEDPNVKPVTSKGQFSARLNGAVAQVIQWKTWLEGNRDMARKILPSYEFWRSDRLPAKYTIIIGRRANADEWNHLRNRYSDIIDIQIRSFDHLTDQVLQRVFAPVPILGSVETSSAEPKKRNELVNPFRKAISSQQWRKAAPQLVDYHMTANNIATLVNLTSTNARLIPFLKDWESLPAERRRFHLEQARLIEKR